MSNLPPLEDILASSAVADGPLARTLATLFEPSPTLFSNLVPDLASRSPGEKANIKSYLDLIEASLNVMSSWDDALKARFVGGHPRIGEVKGLSHLSAKEQAVVATPPDVLARLAHLNRCYERRYPGLIYITFVNGRTRSEIMNEMEQVMGFESSLSLNEPSVESVRRVEVGGKEWKRELERAVVDVGEIAKSRLKAFGVV